MSKSKRNKNVTVNEEKAYTEFMAEQMPEEVDEDNKNEEEEVVKPKKKWSKKKKIAVGVAIGTAVGAAFLGGFATGRKKKKKIDETEVYNFDSATIITDDPEIKAPIESEDREMEQLSE